MSDNDKRHEADVTQVRKLGSGYHITGIHKGRKVSFFADAQSVDSMPTKDAKAFMARSIRNLAKQEEG